MAKKQNQETRLNALIRNYIAKIGELGKEIKNPNLEFGFLFYHPKGFTKEKSGKIKYHGRVFQANKPKKGDLVVISHRTNISPEHIKVMQTSKEKMFKVYDELIKIFFIKNVEYNINLKENFFILSNPIYFDDNKKISMNQFYKTLRNLLYADLYSMMIIQKECSGKIDAKDIKGYGSPYHI